MRVNFSEVSERSSGSMKGLKSINKYKGRDAGDMDGDERRALCLAKFFHFFLFAIFSGIYGAFAFSFWRILQVERPECIAPRNEYL